MQKRLAETKSCFYRHEERPCPKTGEKKQRQVHSSQDGRVTADSHNNYHSAASSFRQGPIENNNKSKGSI
jgi:hypothetical protein